MNNFALLLVFFLKYKPEIYFIINLLNRAKYNWQFSCHVHLSVLCCSFYRRNNCHFFSCVQLFFPQPTFARIRSIKSPNDILILSRFTQQQFVVVHKSISICSIPKRSETEKFCWEDWIVTPSASVQAWQGCSWGWFCCPLTCHDTDLSCLESPTVSNNTLCLLKS